MTRRASTLLRITTVFVMSMVAFLLLATDRSLAQNAPLFLAPVTYSSGGDSNTSVALGDVNGDGKLDIVAANYCVPDCEAAVVGGFAVLLGNGDGTFQAAQVYSLVSGTGGSIALADLNGDGKLDVVISATPSAGCYVGGGGGTVGVFMGNGDGTFQPEQTYKSGGLCTSKLIVADVNGDSKPDVIVAGNCESAQSYCSQSIDGVIGVLRGNGDGSFQAAQTYDSGGVAPRDMIVADVNGDGELDLLVANGGSEQLGYGNPNAALFLGNGDGTFQTAKIFETYNPYSMGLASLAVADLNGDGKPDVVETTCFYNTCTQNAGGLVVQLGNGDGTFQVPQLYNSGRTFPWQVLLADVNLDGKLDAVLVSYNECPGCVPGGVTVLLGNGDGTFSTSLPFSSGGAGAVSAALGDVNGDGRLDVVVANTYTVCGSNCVTSPGAVGVLLGAAKFPTTVSFVSSLNPSIYGQPVSFVARVTPSGPFGPTGTVTFKWGSNYVIGGATLQSDGTATLTKSNLSADSYPLTAVYSGDANNGSSTSPVVNQVVIQATSAAKITSSVNPSTQGQAVTFSAQVTSPTVMPKGPVTFTAGTTVLGTVQLGWAGKANLTTSSLPAGSTVVKVTYEGNSNIKGSSASVIQVVQP